MLENPDRLPYDFDELIDILEKIRDGKRDNINFAKAFYSICLKIKEIEKQVKTEGI